MGKCGCIADSPNHPQAAKYRVVAVRGCSEPDSRSWFLDEREVRSVCVWPHANKLGTTLSTMQRLLRRCKCPQPPRTAVLRPWAPATSQGVPTGSSALSIRAGASQGGTAGGSVGTGRGGTTMGVPQRGEAHNSSNVSEDELEKFRHLEK